MIRWMRWAVLAVVMGAASASAQTGEIDLRVGKLEREMRAVQRTVFPGGAPILPDGATPTPPVTSAGDAASTPAADLAARVDALEKGLAALTGTSEETGNRVRRIEDSLKALEARVRALEGGTEPPVASSGGTAEPPAASPTASRPSTTRPVVIPTLKPDPARKAAVAAVEMPVSGDAVEDAYVYGFRLYTAKFYPEAQAKLKEFVAKHPKHKRASYAQNLLGRAYFDEGKPALASVAFYDNYQKMPKGERAAESLYWLGQSLTKLKKLPDACKVYDEFGDVFGATASGQLNARVAEGRADAKCAA